MKKNVHKCLDIVAILIYFHHVQLNLGVFQAVVIQQQNNSIPNLFHHQESYGIATVLFSFSCSKAVIILRAVPTRAFILFYVIFRNCVSLQWSKLLGNV